jgi:hypothetical protein
MRTMYVDHREQEALAHIVHVLSSPAARSQDTRMERPEPAACPREIVEPRKNIQRPAKDSRQCSSFPNSPTSEKACPAGLACRSLSPLARPPGKPCRPALEILRPASFPDASTGEEAGLAGVAGRSLSSPSLLPEPEFSQPLFQPHSRLWFDATAVAAAAAGDDGSREAVRLAMVNSMRQRRDT